LARSVPLSRFAPRVGGGSAFFVRPHSHAMTIFELKAALVRERVRPDAYSFAGGLPNESYCIAPCSDGWEVYYSERGGKTGRQIFRDESSACEYFLAQLLADHTARDLA